MSYFPGDLKNINIFKRTKENGVQKNMLLFKLKHIGEVFK